MLTNERRLLFWIFPKPERIMLLLIFLVINLTFCQRFPTNTYSFGLNNFGQLGDDTFISSNLPKLSGGFEFRMVSKTISSGMYHTLILSEGGQVYSFGNNRFGQLGVENTTLQYKIPVLINPSSFGDAPVIKVAAGANHSLVLTKFGKVFSFGKNDRGQLGINHYIDTYIPTVVNQGNLKGIRIVDIAAGDVHSILLGENGKIYGMGSNINGQVGDGRTNYPQDYRKIPIGMYFFQSPYFIGIAAGSFHSVGLTNKSEIYGSGNGYQGQMGSQSFTEYRTPMKAYLTGNITKKIIIKIYAGGNVTMALTSEGDLIAYGQGIGGQLCNNRLANINNPLIVQTSERIVDVSLGHSHTFLINSNNNLFGCGNNSFGQLGTGDEINRFQMTKINLSPVKYVSSGYGHTVASLMYDCRQMLNCTNRGACIAPQECKCNDGYSGRMCEKNLCFGLPEDSPSVCSGNGKCTSPNTCKCINGFEGEKCNSCQWQPSGGYCKQPWSFTFYYIFSFLVGSGFLFCLCIVAIIIIIAMFIMRKRLEKKKVDYDKELKD